MNLREFSYPASFEEPLQRALRSYDLSLENSSVLAQCVQNLSDYFIAKPQAHTPWQERWAQIAYLVYFLPLNSARLQGIISEADKRGFFSGLEHVVDFGAGLATASLTLAEKKSFHYQLIERATEPQKIVETFFPRLPASQWSRAWSAGLISQPEKTLAVFSYSLTELEKIPDWALRCEGLMLVEPSTQQDGRALMHLREDLLARGYHLWAPCTHAQACPLLTQSKHDWCHDRIHFKAPAWFQKMEEHLPMKNRTLTMSYLLLRRTPPTPVSAARTVGDRLEEKGKDRQLICRGPEREFLAWMHKNKIRQEIPRGILVQIPEQAEKKSNEIRIAEELKTY